MLINNLSDELPDLAYFGVSSGLEFAVDEPVVDFDLKASTIAGNQRPAIDVGREFLEQLLRHTDGSREIVSRDTVGDRDFEHGLFLLTGVVEMLTSIEYNRDEQERGSVSVLPGLLWYD